MATPTNIRPQPHRFNTTMLSLSLFDLSPSQPQCPICQNDLVDTVSLPCFEKHQYCRECLATWLLENDSCPTCRATVLASTPPESMNHLHQIQLAVQMSLLGEPSDPDRPTHLETFGLEQVAPNVGVFTSGTVCEAMALAARHMARVEFRSTPGTHGALQGNQKEVFQGLGLINADILLVHLIAMAKFVRAWAAIQKKGLNNEDSKDWSLIVQHIGKVIAAQHGKKKDMAIFRRRLRRGLQVDKSTRDLDFLAVPWTSALADQLLDYVAFVAREHARQCGTQKTSTTVKKNLAKAAFQTAVAMQGCKVM